MYLVSHYGPARRTRVCRNDDAAIEDASHDSSTSGCRFGQRDALSVEGEVSIMVAEVEAGHLCGCATLRFAAR